MSSTKNTTRVSEAFLFQITRGSAVALPLVTLAGFELGGVWTYLGFFQVFVFYFCIEFLLKALGFGTQVAEGFSDFTSSGKGLRDTNLPLYIYSFIYFIAFLVIMITVGKRDISSFETLGVILSLGAMAGSVGGLASHEFIHRSSRMERFLGIALLGSMNYSHFRVSHLGGHHRNVGLREDWSTARHRESFYHFLFRAIFHGISGAWSIEEKRLGRAGKSVWSFQNFMVRYAAVQICLHTTVVHFLGWKSELIFCSFSLIAISLAEMVNYLSHYGLARTKTASGNREPIGDFHSWNSPNKVTNWFIFNAGKHSDHHLSPAMPHDRLGLSYKTAMLPYGLPAMTLIGLIPPLFFRIMDPLLEEAIQRRSNSLGRADRIFVKSKSKVTPAKKSVSLAV